MEQKYKEFVDPIKNLQTFSANDAAKAWGCSFIIALNRILKLKKLGLIQVKGKAVWSV